MFQETVSLVTPQHTLMYVSYRLQRLAVLNKSIFALKLQSWDFSGGF